VTARVLDDYAAPRLFYEREDSAEEYFHPGMDGIDQIVQVLFQMRELMRKPNERLWEHVRFALEQDGKFDVQYGYGREDKGTGGDAR
jgi:hypothetical protein